MPLKKASDIRELVKTKYKDLTKEQEGEISLLIDNHLKSDSVEEFIDVKVDITPELKVKLVNNGYTCKLVELEEGETLVKYYRISWKEDVKVGIKASGKSFDNIKEKEEKKKK